MLLQLLLLVALAAIRLLLLPLFIQHKPLLLACKLLARLLLLLLLHWLMAKSRPIAGEHMSIRHCWLMLLQLQLLLLLVVGQLHCIAAACAGLPCSSRYWRAALHCS